MLEQPRNKQYVHIIKEFGVPTCQENQLSNLSMHIYQKNAFKKYDTKECIVKKRRHPYSWMARLYVRTI